jgi:cobalt-precorrin 5A hydrolase
MSVSMLAIGVGCRAGCPAEAIATLVQRALSSAGVSGSPALFTSVDKHREAGIAAAAVRLALPLVYLPRASLEAAAPDAQTRSERVVSLFGVPSIAETAALAGAGPGAKLIVPRMAADGATCAIAMVPLAGDPA